MVKNSNLNKAKKAKNDEFYTRLPDIERELFQYKHHFEGKKIFLNCDNPEYSMFWMYFKLNFNFFGLRKLVATHYEVSSPSYKLEIFKTPENDKKRNDFDTVKTPLKQNGDFRSPEAIEILKDCDVVVTNPPFSLFREYIAQLMEHDKKFVIVGNPSAITYKEVFKYIKAGRVWLGVKSMGVDMLFSVSAEFASELQETKKEGSGYKIVDGVVLGRAQAIWFTNLAHGRRNEELFLYKSYKGNEVDYPKYDNYDAINVDKVKHIPKDYFGAMGVPITFLGKFNPKQFEVNALGIIGSISFSSNKKMEILDKYGESTGRFTFNAKGTLYRPYNPKKDKVPSFKDYATSELYSSIYARIIIKRK